MIWFIRNNIEFVSCDKDFLNNKENNPSKWGGKVNMINSSLNLNLKSSCKNLELGCHLRHLRQCYLLPVARFEKMIKK